MLTTIHEGDLLIATDLRRAAGPVFVVLGVACSLLLVWLAVSQYVVAQLTSEKVVPAQDQLLRAEKYLPTSAGLEARLAEAMTISNPSEADRHALRAISLSPHNYKYWSIHASVKEKQEDFQAAEESLRHATALAPGDGAIRFRLAKLLGERGRMTEATAEFRRATTMEHASLAAALDLVWKISNGDVSSAEAATSEDARDRLLLANFLLDRSRASDAARVFGEIKDKPFLNSAGGATFLNALITAGHLKLAHNLWVKLVGSSESLLIWNGDFEHALLEYFTHFDWTIEENKQARIAIDDGVAHTGQRSLRLEFIGRETTSLNNEVRQLILLDAGARYRLQGYAKSEQLVSPQGPRVVVNSVEESIWLGASAPLREGTSDWQQLTIDFVAPQSRSAAAVPVLISIKQTLVVGSDGPTRGTVWFDDFTLTKFEK